MYSASGFLVTSVLRRPLCSENFKTLQGAYCSTRAAAAPVLQQDHVFCAHYNTATILQTRLAGISAKASPYLRVHLALGEVSVKSCMSCGLSKRVLF